MVSWLHDLLHWLGLRRLTPYLCKLGLHRFDTIYLESDTRKRAFGRCDACAEWINWF